MPEDEPRDTGDLAAAPESEWNKTDRGEGANAMDDGDDTDTVQAHYDDPGAVVDEELA